MDRSMALFKQSGTSVLLMVFLLDVLTGVGCPVTGILRRSGCAEIVVIENGKNLGFAGGVNSGLLLCKIERYSSYALLLNNDVKVSPDFLRCLVDTAKGNAGAGIVGGKILYEPQQDLFEGRSNVIWYAGGRINLLKGCGYVCFGNGKPDDGTWDHEGPTGFVTGAMMLIAIGVLDSVGLLDSRFFFGGEDTDYCLRARRKGFRVFYSPRAKIWHKSTAFTYDDNTLVRLTYEYAGKVLLWLKYVPVWLRWLLLACHVLYGILIVPFRLSSTARRHGATLPQSAVRAAFRRSLVIAFAEAKSDGEAG